MSYHNTNQNIRTTSSITNRVSAVTSNVLTTIDGAPLFRTIQQALAYGQQVGLRGYHTHNFQGVVGYMAGFDHTQASTATAAIVETKKL